MKLLGLSKTDLAKLTGLNRPRLTQQLNGTQSLTSQTIKKLLTRAFQMSTEEAETQLLRWKAEEARKKAEGLTGADPQENKRKSQVIMVSDDEILLATKTFIDSNKDHFILGIASGELVRSRFAFSPSQIKDFKRSLDDAIQFYEHHFGSIF